MPQRRVIVGLVGGLLALSSVLRAAPAADAPKERRLHVASAEASSFLVNDWNKFQENYLPLYVGDDDPKTAWTLKTEGIGEWLRVHVTPMAGATKVRLAVRNGYQKSDKLWAANSRAKGLTVVLLPSKKTVDVELTDSKGWQEIAVEQPAGAFDAFELRVRSVYPGKKYDDLCLSDVQVFATATTADNPAFEKQRLQKILDWKKERLAAAKLFQTEMGRRMPIAPQYVLANPNDEGEATVLHASRCRDALCYLEERLKGAAVGAARPPSADLKLANELSHKHFGGMLAVRISTRDKRAMPVVDGTCMPTLDACVEDPCGERLPLPPQVGYLDGRTLVTTEQQGLPGVDDVLALNPPECKRPGETTFAYVLRDSATADGSPGDIRAVLRISCGLVDGREGMYPVARPQLLVYAPNGALAVIADAARATEFEWSHDDGSPKLAAAHVTEDPDAKALVFTASGAVVAGK